MGYLTSIGIDLVNIVLRTNSDIVSRSELQRRLITIKREHKVRGVRVDPSGRIVVTGEPDTSLIERMLLSFLIDRIEQMDDSRERYRRISSVLLEEIDDRDAVFALAPEPLRVVYQGMLTATLARKYLESISTMQFGSLEPSPPGSIPPQTSPAGTEALLGTADRPREDIVLDYADMLDIRLERAERLYDAGYKTFSTLKTAPYPHLASLVGKETATYIRERLGNPVSREEYLSSLGVPTSGARQTSQPPMVPPVMMPPPGMPPPTMVGRRRRRRLPRRARARLALQRYRSRRRRYAAGAAILLLTLWGAMFSFWEFGGWDMGAHTLVPVDWSSEVIYDDPADARIPPESDITGYAVSLQDDVLTLRVRLEGTVGNGANYGAYIDMDGSALSGYPVRGMGADVRVEARSTPDGLVCTFTEYGSTGFNGGGRLPCQNKGSILDIQFSRGGISPGSNAVYSFHAVSKDGFTDESRAVVVHGRGALVLTRVPLVTGVVPPQDSPLLQVRAEAKGTGVHVRSLTLTSLGISFIGPQAFDIPAGEGRTLTIIGRSDRPASEVVTLDITGVDTDAATWTLEGWGLRAYSIAPPGQISIDGAFADWSAVLKYQDDPENMPPPADIVEFAIASEPGGYSFYVRSAVQILEGTWFPVHGIMNATGGGGGGVVIPREDDTDILRVHIDLDSDITTGERWGDLGADMMFEVQGKAGSITARDLFEYRGTKWVRVSGVAAETHGRELEASLGAGLDLSGARVGFELTNWAGKSDATKGIATLMASEPMHDPTVADLYVPLSKQIPTIDGNLDLPAEYANAFHRVFQIFVDGGWRDVDLYLQRNGSTLADSMYMLYTFAGDAGSTNSDYLYVYFEGVGLRSHDGQLQTNVDRRFVVRRDAQISSAVWDGGGWSNAAWSNVQADVTYQGGQNRYTFEIRIGLDNLFGSDTQFLSLADKGFRLFFMDNGAGGGDRAYPRNSDYQDASTWADLDFVWLQVNGTSFAPPSIRPGNSSLMERVVLTPSTEEMTLASLTLRLTGNATDTDVAPAGARVYIDDGDGVYDPVNDTLLNGSGATFTSGMARFVNAPLMYLPGPATLWLTLEINTTAVIGHRIGVSLVGIDDLIVLGNASSVVVSLSGLPIYSGLSLITIPALTWSWAVVASTASLMVTALHTLRRGRGRSSF